MSEKFVYNQSDRIGWLFIEAVAGLKLDHPVFDTFKAGDGIEVEMTVNGVPVPFSRTMALLDASYTACVESRALELAQERAGELLAGLADFQDFVSRKIREAFPGAACD